MNPRPQHPSRIWAFQVAGLFDEAARYLALNQAGPFQVKAYERAALALKEHAPRIPALAAEGRLATLKGLGRHIIEHIEEFQSQGQWAFLDDLKKRTDPELALLLRLPGLDNEQLALLSGPLGINNLADLEQAIQSGRLDGIPGLGPAEAERLRAGINFLKPLLGRHLWPHARAEADKLANWLKEAAGFWRLELAGELRLGRETVGTLELVGSGWPGRPRTELTEAVIRALHSENTGWLKKFSLGEQPGPAAGQPDSVVFSLELDGDFQARLYLTEAERFAAIWHYYSAAPAYLAELEAARPGLDLFPTLIATCHPAEERLFEYFGIPFIEPLLREGQGEVRAALRGHLPAAVVREDLRGFFHAHTTASDGQLNLEELVQAARAEGFQYMGLSDHSQADRAGHGLSLPELAAQKNEVERLRALEPGVEIFWGLESAILPDGSLDYWPEILAGFDFVIASAHSNLDLAAEAQTARILKALENPFTSILGHPTGREMLVRPPCHCRLEEIIPAAIRNGCALEINSQPHRLDLPWFRLKEARDLGAKFFISPDIHAGRDLDNLVYGLTAARKGWLEKADILNALPVGDMKAWLNWRKRRAGALG